MPRMRSRSVCSKPLQMDKAVMSTMTPSASPKTEVREMKDTKWLRRLARV